MGLDMHSKQKICNEICRRYQKAGKKGKGLLLDEYVQTLGYNRDYLAHLLANWGKTRYAAVDGKSVGDASRARKNAPGGKKGEGPLPPTPRFAVLFST